MKNVFHLSPEKFEEDLSDTDLRFIGNYSAEFLNIPPMLEDFWDIMYKRAVNVWEDNNNSRIVPKQDEFLQKYMDKHWRKFDEYSDNKQEGIRARVLKTYPSLVRESHFISQMQEISIQDGFPSTLLISNSGLDMSKGVDLALQLNGVSFSIKITKTDSKTDWQEIKKQRKADIDTPNPVVVIANESNTFRVGNGEEIFLFKRKTVRKVLEECMKNT